MTIEGRVPVNKTAARVMGKGIQYTPDKKIVQVHSENPLPLIPISWNEKNLKGIKFGKLTVMGKFSSGKKAMWSCRCLCGRYCARSSKAIHNPKNNADCCAECQQLEFLKRRERELK